MPNSITRAYQLGCKYAMDLVKVAAPPAAEAAKAGKSLWQHFMGSAPAQYAAAGLGGGALGATAAGEGNRTRGFMMGAGAGLGARGLGGLAKGKAREMATKGIEKSLGEQAAAAEAGGQQFVRPAQELIDKAVQEHGRIGAGIGVGLGGLGGLVAGRGLAPGHEAPPQSWFQRARGLLPI